VVPAIRSGSASGMNQRPPEAVHSARLASTCAISSKLEARQGR
jgi:hypothetical protein